MSATLVAKGLGHGHADRTLFRDLDLIVAPGDVVGLVGVNGAGKTTLLRTLAGLMAPEVGTITLSPPGATVGYLPQEPDRRDRESVRQFLARRTGVAAAQADLDATGQRLSDGLPGAEDAYHGVLERWLGLGGADLDERAEAMAHAIGVGLDQPMTAISGGQAARAGLASLLLSRYDLFLLDEPTNDLDLDGLQRLEAFVDGLRAGTVLVSHDREFLARTVTRILELDLAQQQVRVFGGGYESYLEEREIAQVHAREEYDDYAQRVTYLKARAHVQRAWMEKGVRDARRKAKDSDKIGRKFRTEASEKQAAKVRQTERMIATPSGGGGAPQGVAAADGDCGGPALRGRGGDAAPGSGASWRFTLGPVDLQIDWRDRIAITGPNGVRQDHSAGGVARPRLPR